MRDKHGPDHPEDGFLICHIPKDLQYATVLPFEPRLREVLIEFPDDFVMAPMTQIDADWSRYQIHVFQNASNYPSHPHT